MMNKLRTLLASGLMAASLSLQAADIEVNHAYVNAPPPVSKVAAGYFVLHNKSHHEVTLESLASPVAEKVELHETKHEHGQMKMSKVEHLNIEGHSMVELSPGNMHLMFMKLKKGLHPGDSVPVTLHFSDGAEIRIEAEVRDMRESPEPMPMDHSQHHGSDHQHH